MFRDFFHAGTHQTSGFCWLSLVVQLLHLAVPPMVTCHRFERAMQVQTVRSWGYLFGRSWF